jgi:hypothetical protein
MDVAEPGMASSVAAVPPSAPPALLPAWLIQLAALSVLVLLLSAALKWAMPENNTTQRAFPFMLLVSLGGLVASLWMWFLRQRRSNGMVAAFVLTNMAAVAVMILPFALATTAFRRGNDPKAPAPDRETPPPVLTSHSVAPAALAGLGYLPDSCNVVAAIHVAELMEQPIGQKLLAPPKAGMDAERPWLLEQGLARVLKLTGLKAEEIDHLVFGTKGEAGLSTIAFVVRTRKTYDPAALARAQLPVVPVNYHDKDLFQFRVELGTQGPFPLGGQGLLWCADPQTMILLFNFALAERDKELLTDRPRGGTQTPPRPLRPFLAQRLSQGTPIWWAAAELERPEMFAGLLPVAAKDAQLARVLQKTHSLTVGLRLQQDAALLGNIECPDQATAKRLSELLAQQRMPGFDAPKVAGPAPDEPRPWVSFQMRGSPERVAEALRSLRLMGALPKQ